MSWADMTREEIERLCRQLKMCKGCEHYSEPGDAIRSGVGHLRPVVMTGDQCAHRTEELAKCPFCGGEAGSHTGIPGECYPSVSCARCGLRIGKDTLESSREAWNRLAAGVVTGACVIVPREKLTREAVAVAVGCESGADLLLAHLGLKP